MSIWLTSRSQRASTSIWVTEAVGVDFNLLMQAAGFDLELPMEGDDFFAYDAVIEGVGFDSEPLMQNLNRASRLMVSVKS